MHHTDVPREQLLREIAALRERNAELEAEMRMGRAAERALIERETRYRHLVELSRGFICIHNLDGYFLYVNPTSAQEIGYRVEDMVGRKMDQFLAPSIRHEFPAYLERIRHNLTDSGLISIVTKQGEERIWSYRNVRIEELDNSPYVIGHAQDITGQVKAEQALKHAHHMLEQRVSERTIALQKVNAELQTAILENEQAVQALQEAEEKYRTFVHYASDAIVIIQNERVVYANPACEQLFGYTLDEVLRMPHVFTDFVVPEERKRLLDNHRRRLLGESVPEYYETAIVNKEGHHLVVEVKPCRIPFRGHTAIMVLMRDITARKQTEDALRDSEMRYRTLVEGSIQGISVRDQNGIRVFANQAHAHIFGYDNPLDLIGRPVREQIAPHERERLLRDTLERFQRDDMPARFIYQGLRKDGTPIWLENVVSRITWEGQPAQLTTLVDITDRKQAEESLRQSEERFAKAFHSCPVPMGIARLSDGHVLDVNESFLDMMGYRREDVIGHAATTLEHYWAAPEDRQRLIKSLFANRTIRDFATQLRTQSGELRDVLLSAELIELSAAYCILATIYDITEYKRLEAQLRQSQKLEALGTLGGGLAHEYNNILASILGFAELSTAALSSTHPVHQYLQHILTSGRRAKDLVQQILTFSRQNTSKRQPVSMTSLVQEGLILIRASLPTTVAIEQSITDGAGMVLADPTHMNQILINLCANAEYAMRDDGGILTISVEEVEFNDAQSTVSIALPDGPYVHLRIQDSGHGMPSEVLNRVFEPFFTTKAIGDGTGMGLAIVHGIITDHEGVITVESAPGEGATFDIYLPRLIDVAVSATETSEQAPPQGAGNILFVDDEEMLVHLVQTTLKRLGYEVVAYTSSTEALAAFQKTPEDFDIVITDQTMPDLTGEHLAAELRRIRPDIPVVLCTGFSHAIDAKKANSLGINAFLMKPIEPRELAATIQQVLEQPSSG